MRLLQNEIWTAHSTLYIKSVKSISVFLIALLWTLRHRFLSFILYSFIHIFYSLYSFSVLYRILLHLPFFLYLCLTPYLPILCIFSYTYIFLYLSGIREPERSRRILCISKRERRKGVEFERGFWIPNQEKIWRVLRHVAGVLSTTLLTHHQRQRV